MCVRTILTTVYHMNHYACSYWASGQVFIFDFKDQYGGWQIECIIYIQTLNVSQLKPSMDTMGNEYT